MLLQLVLVVLVFSSGVTWGVDLSPCPDNYGTCNKCFKVDGKVVAITRDVCGDYTKEKCIKIFNAEGGLCSDGCNGCYCDEKSLASSKGVCPPYSKKNCTELRGEKPFECNGRTCLCTDGGMGTYSD